MKTTAYKHNSLELGTDILEQGSFGQFHFPHCGESEGISVYCHTECSLEFAAVSIQVTRLDMKSFRETHPLQRYLFDVPRD